MASEIFQDPRGPNQTKRSPTRSRSSSRPNRAAGRSKVTFEIEPAGRMVKLTVVHDDFDPGSTVVTMVSEGWPRLLSDLKTLLEEGKKR
jgi:Activator of Hsp90 ATPase homolog 1-like protein